MNYICKMIKTEESPSVFAEINHTICNWKFCNFGRGCV